MLQDFFGRIIQKVFFSFFWFDILCNQINYAIFAGLLVGVLYLGVKEADF